MPIYEFACDSCKQVIEFTMKFSDPMPEKCSHCNGGPLKKLISKTSFQLKGGGWYSHGYSASPPKKSSDSGSESKPDSSAGKSDSSSAKSDSSPAKSDATAAPSGSKPSTDKT
ncbi:MAG: FmdB family zinc ribbon protein [Oligoflexales bacterium]